MMLYLWKHALFCWVDLGNMIMMHIIMVGVINTLMHKGKKITLLPLTPAQIVQVEKDRAANANNEPPVKSENQQAIQLKAPVMLTTKSVLAEIHVDDTCCYALVCTDALFYNDDIAHTLSAHVTNLLQEFINVFSAES
jgi:hypothetical protein